MILNLNGQKQRYNFYSWKANYRSRQLFGAADLHVVAHHRRLPQFCSIYVSAFLHNWGKRKKEHDSCIPTSKCSHFIGQKLSYGHSYLQRGGEVSSSCALRRREEGRTKRRSSIPRKHVDLDFLESTENYIANFLLHEEMGLRRENKFSQGTIKSHCFYTSISYDFEIANTSLKPGWLDVWDCGISILYQLSITLLILCNKQPQHPVT